MIVYKRSVAYLCNLQHSQGVIFQREIDWR